MAAVRRAFDGAHAASPRRASVAPLFEERAPRRPKRYRRRSRDTSRRSSGRATPTPILLLPNSFGSAWIAQPQRHRRALGLSRRRPRLAADARRAAAARHVHQVQYYLELVRGLGIEAADDVRGSGARAGDAAAGRRAARRRRRRHRISAIVGFAPGAAYGHAKRWPPDRVAQVDCRR